MATSRGIEPRSSDRQSGVIAVIQWSHGCFGRERSFVDPLSADCSTFELQSNNTIQFLEASHGIEPWIWELQSHALPLDHEAKNYGVPAWNRTMVNALWVRRSAIELQRHVEGVWTSYRAITIPFHTCVLFCEYSNTTHRNYSIFNMVLSHGFEPCIQHPQCCVLPITLEQPNIHIYGGRRGHRTPKHWILSPMALPISLHARVNHIRHRTCKQRHYHKS